MNGAAKQRRNNCASLSRPPQDTHFARIPLGIDLSWLLCGRTRWLDCLLEQPLSEKHNLSEGEKTSKEPTTANILPTANSYRLTKQERQTRKDTATTCFQLTADLSQRESCSLKSNLTRDNWLEAPTFGNQTEPNNSEQLRKGSELLAVRPRIVKKALPLLELSQLN